MAAADHRVPDLVAAAPASAGRHEIEEQRQRSTAQSLASLFPFRNRRAFVNRNGRFLIPFHPSCTAFYSVLLGFTGFQLVLRGFAGFYWVSLCFIGFYLVLQGFIGFYWVLLYYNRFYWVLLGFIGFYWVLLGLIGFYGVLLDFTGFD